MKKLLALILCVMMFVSVFAVSASADYVDNAKAVKNAKSNIEYMYGVLAADNSVFGTVEAIDGIVVDMAKGLFADAEEGIDSALFGYSNGVISQDKLTNNAKSLLRGTIGHSITKYMNDHIDSFRTTSNTFVDPVWHATINPATGAVYDAKLSFTGVIDGSGSMIYSVSDVPGLYWGLDKGGNWYWTNAASATAAASGASGWTMVGTTGTGAAPAATTKIKYDPIAYAEAFATAATKAFTDKTNAKELEKVFYQMAAAKVFKDVNDDLKDLRDDITEWQDGNNILAAYGWHSIPSASNPTIWTPYAFLGENTYPETFEIPATLLAP